MYGKIQHVGWESRAFLLEILSVGVSRMLLVMCPQGGQEHREGGRPGSLARWMVGWLQPIHNLMDGGTATAWTGLLGGWGTWGLQLDGRWDGHRSSTARWTE